MIVGLTGGIASGKSTISQIFKTLAIKIIDTDEIAREITQPNYPATLAILEKFGPEITSDSATINRNKLKSIVFNDSKKRKELEAILHPIIYQQVVDEIKNHHDSYIIVVVPLLAENPEFLKLVDRVLVVDIDEPIQIKRIINRDNCSLNTAKSILAAQATRNERLTIADDVIKNNSDFKKLEQQVEKLHRHYMKLAKQKLISEKKI